MKSEMDRPALMAAGVCYLFWGLMPLLFQAAGRAGAGSWEVVAERSIWALPCVALLVAFTGGMASVRAVLADRQTLLLLLLAAVLIGGNWMLYVVAVQNHNTLSAALAYYINPLMNMAAGALFFRERIDRTGAIAIALAAAGVALQALALGAFPWVSLTIAAAFCAYGIVKKKVRVDAQTGLLVECAVLAVPGALYAVWLAQSGGGVFGRSTEATLLLLAGGPITVIPLAAFAFAMRRLPMTMLGFLQFVSPTMVFAIGVMNGEPLTGLRIASFALIWAGVGVFAWGLWRSARLAGP